MSRWKETLEIVVAVVGILGGTAGLVGLVVAIRSMQLSQKAYDRAAGKVLARLEPVGVSPNNSDIPQALLSPDLSGRPAVRFTSVARLQSLNAFMYVKNAGDDPIDGLRLETLVDQMGIHNENGPPEREWGLRSEWAAKPPSREDIELSRKLMPGETAKVSLTRGILKQIMAYSEKDFPTLTHLGHFQFRCHARLVGTTSYDESDRGATLTRMFMWVPTGFDEERCKAYLDEYPSNASIVAPGFKGSISSP